MFCFGAVQRFEVLGTFATLDATNVKSHFHRQHFILLALVIVVAPLTRWSRD